MKEYSGILVVVVVSFCLFVCLLLYFTHTAPPRPAPFMKGLASKTNKSKA